MNHTVNTEFIAVNVDMGDLLTVRQNLQELIIRARGKGDNLTTGFLLQKLGDVEAMSGNVERAESLHSEALALDPDNPLPLLLYAKGLLKAFRRPDLALTQLGVLEKLLNSGRWVQGDDEPPREYYESEASILRKEIDHSQEQQTPS